MQIFFFHLHDHFSWYECLHTLVILEEEGNKQKIYESQPTNLYHIKMPCVKKKKTTGFDQYSMQRMKWVKNHKKKKKL